MSGVLSLHLSPSALRFPKPSEEVTPAQGCQDCTVRPRGPPFSARPTDVPAVRETARAPPHRSLAGDPSVSARPHRLLRTVTVSSGAERGHWVEGSEELPADLGTSPHPGTPADAAPAPELRAAGNRTRRGGGGSRAGRGADQPPATPRAAGGKAAGPPARRSWAPALRPPCVPQDPGPSRTTESFQGAPRSPPALSGTRGPGPRQPRSANSAAPGALWDAPGTPARR